jgi:hypothetical protein
MLMTYVHAIAEVVIFLPLLFALRAFIRLLDAWLYIVRSVQAIITPPCIQVWGCLCVFKVGSRSVVRFCFSIIERVCIVCVCWFTRGLFVCV